MGDVNMVSVVSNAGTVVVSNRHSLAVDGGKSYMFAGDLKAGKDSLVTQNGSATVEKVADTRANGLYAPLTRTSNFFVGGPGQRPAVLAHSFAQLEQPRRYEAAFHLFLNIAEFFFPSLSEVEETCNEPYVHPVARAWMRLAGIPTTQEMAQLITRRTIQPNGDHGFDAIEGPTPRRRLSNSGKSENQGENDVVAILFAVVHNLPPFMAHGIIPEGNEDFFQGVQYQPEEPVNEWVDDGKTMNVWNAVILALVWIFLVCCCILKKAKTDRGGS